VPLFDKKRFGRPVPGELIKYTDPPQAVNNAFPELWQLSSSITSLVGSFDEFFVPLSMRRL